MRAYRPFIIIALALPAGACGTAGSAGAQVPVTAAPVGSRADTTGRDLVPAGFGALRQDQVAVSIQLPAVQVRAIPLDEGVIRLLSPDSYRAMRGIEEGQRAKLADIASRRNLRNPSLWYISYYGLVPDAQFNPSEVVINNGGRDFRPVEIIPLTSGFGEHRIAQRGVQAAVYVFEDDINVGQPLTVTIESVSNDSWDDSMLQMLDRERTLVRSRAGKGTGKP